MLMPLGYATIHLDNLLAYNGEWREEAGTLTLGKDITFGLN